MCFKPSIGSNLLFLRNSRAVIFQKIELINIILFVLFFAIVACFQPLGMEDQSIPKQNVKSSVQDNIFNAGLNYAGRNQFVGGAYKSG